MGVTSNLVHYELLPAIVENELQDQPLECLVKVLQVISRVGRFEPASIHRKDGADFRAKAQGVCKLNGWHH